MKLYRNFRNKTINFIHLRSGLTVTTTTYVQHQHQQQPTADEQTK